MVVVAAAPPPKPTVRREDVPDDAKLYVSNLPSTMNNDLLRSVFAPFGEVRLIRAHFSIFRHSLLEQTPQVKSPSTMNNDLLHC